jgi:NADP-dependent 3-hydroxy acid dehydrogenase YdfG
MPRPISYKVWFITGASKGFGYVWTEAALARGDRVAAAARNIGSLDALKAKYGNRLLPLALDVGNKAAVDAAVSAICGNSEPLRFAVSIADLQTNAR